MRQGSQKIKRKTLQKKRNLQSQRLNSNLLIKLSLIERKVRHLIGHVGKIGPMENLIKMQGNRILKIKNIQQVDIRSTPISIGHIILGHRNM